MGELKAGQPFGLDVKFVGQIDWDLALSRVENDIKTDFIYAPHLSYIYARAGSDIVSELRKQLESGEYLPGTPMTIEVPKSFRMRVAANIARLGPNYTRPGSILMPYDRLFYQAIANESAQSVNKKINPQRSFSHRLDEAGSSSMFLTTRKCWSELQQALTEYSKDPKIKYIIKIDVANFFGSLNQHILANHLMDAGVAKSLVSRLELMLTTFAGNRSSRGILQGIYPSDLFGNFYLCGFDQFIDDLGKASARYVDDIYLFVESVEAAEQLLRLVISELRSYDLVINEAKASIIPKNSLITEEPDLEELFDDALDEVSSQIEDDDFDVDYGFQSEWIEASDENVEGKGNPLELAATRLLFDAVGNYKGHEENIERFCLPLFMKANSDYAISHVISSFLQRPSLTQIYSAYLALFLTDDKVRSCLKGHLNDKNLFDWQKMWILAALLQDKEKDDATVKFAFSIFSDTSRHDALRAVAAIYVGRNGDALRRKSLSTAYGTVSAYVQSAIYYSSKDWPGAEKANAKADWGLANPLNSLITKANPSKSAAKSSLL